MKLLERSLLVVLALAPLGMFACSGCGDSGPAVRSAGTVQAPVASPRAAPAAQSAAQPNASLPANPPEPNTMKPTTKSETTAETLTPARVEKTQLEWKQVLSPLEYSVLREKGTERAFSGKLWNSTGEGEYSCAGCGNLLFTGKDKFISDCGWPAFDKCIKGSIDEHKDTTHGMLRTEVTCARCGGHLGHIFDDGPTATGMRYCINSVSIKFTPKPAATAGAGLSPQDEKK